MRISRKIGLSFFVTFLLVITLGILSIYSLRHVYRGLSQVFAKDLPASRITYQIAISMEELLSELNKFLITHNENFKISYEDSYKKMQDSVSDLKRFIIKDDEKAIFDEMIYLSEEINTTAGVIFENRKKSDSLSDDLKKIRADYEKKLDELFDFEEKKMLSGKDLLSIQAQDIPASDLVMKAKLNFLDLFAGLNSYIMSDEEPEKPLFIENLLALDKSLRDYKNYYAYLLSDKERSVASGLILMNESLRLKMDSIVKLKKETRAGVDSLLTKEKDFMEALDKIIAFRKSGISSKLGVGAALTEDIPAIYNISQLEKDITKSWRLSGRYVLTADETYKTLYYQLRENIDKELKDYGRHARLRGTEQFVDSIAKSDEDVLKAIDSNVEALEKRGASLLKLTEIKTALEKKIDGLLGQNDSRIKEAKGAAQVLDKLVPERWLLMKLKNGLASSFGLIMSYLNKQEARYKDEYSEEYFDMKKYISRYRPMRSSTEFVEEMESGLDEFNAAILDLIDAHDKVMKERGWTLVELEDDLKGYLREALEIEILQVEKNKKDLMNRIKVINLLIFIIIGVVAFIAVFVIFYTTNSITNPIQKLYSGAEIIGRGDLDHRLNIKTGDEIQDLAEGFNRMAGELKELYANLENKVRERTIQLAEANEALGRTNKELDDFTYIVSHDLKEPLRGVKAFTKLLLEDYSKKLDKEGLEHLRIISESGTRMTKLIEDLLNLSRIGRIKNVESDIDLNEVLSDVKKNLLYSLEEKKADLRVSGDFPKVMCDRIRISEVFTNLISNAVKYAKKDVRPVIEVGYLDKGEFYEFYVKDNGVGIEEEYYDRVFQIFQRLQAKGEHEGTGAGLTIVKKIIESHGGKIWVESKVGAGSAFYFTLPKR